MSQDTFPNRIALITSAVSEEIHGMNQIRFTHEKDQYV